MWTEREYQAIFWVSPASLNPFSWAKQKRPMRDPLSGRAVEWVDLDYIMSWENYDPKPGLN